MKPSPHPSLAFQPPNAPYCSFLRKSLWGAALLLVAAPLGRAQTTTIVKYHDSTEPDFFRIIGAPSINGAGTVAFFGGGGVFTSDGTTLTTILNSSENYFSLDTPSINATGSVAFRASSNDAGGRVIVSGNGGPVATVATVQSTSYTEFFQPSINAAGRVAFVAQLGVEQGLYYKDGSAAINTVALSSNSTYSSFGDPSVNGSGTLAFQAQFDQLPGGGPSTSGIYTFNEGNTTTIADTTGTTFRGFDLGTSINASGTVAFSGRNSASADGVFTSDGTTVTTIALDSGPSFSDYSGFRDVSINSSGTVAFVGVLKAGGFAIIVGNGTNFTEVVRTGDTLFGGTVNSLSIGGTSLNDSNQLAFTYGLPGNVTGVAVASVVLTGTVQTPFTQWAADHNLTGNDALKSADPDGDGRTNLEEFAFDGDPKSGTDDGKRTTLLKGETYLPPNIFYLTLTLPVRTGAVFSGSPPSATLDGITYTVLADDDLKGGGDLSAIVYTPSNAGRPPLDGYIYRSFRLKTFTLQTPQAFIRIKVTEAP